MSLAGARREQVVRHEVLAPEAAEGLAGMLDIDVPQGDLVPPLWHWIYLLERRPQRDLGPDGHPLSGIPAPPGPERRRMFAGGRVWSHRPLMLRKQATRTTWVVNTTEKCGRTGPLTFVTARSEFTQDGALAIEEEQDIVYRAPGPPLPPPPHDKPIPQPRTPSLGLDVDARLLFRFSALTYNAHRIHYDRDYVPLEGYPDLVVHGPLQALMMGELFRRNGVNLLDRQYSYRLVTPMIGAQRMTVVAAEEGLQAGAETRDAAGTVTAVSHLR